MWWAWETEDAFRAVRGGDKGAMKAYAAKLTRQLGELTAMVRARAPAHALRKRRAQRAPLLTQAAWRAAAWTSERLMHPLLHAPPPQVRGELSPDARRKVNTLVITDVHARDIIDGFVRDSVLDAREFAWESQLRFYWDRGLVRRRARALPLPAQLAALPLSGLQLCTTH